MDAAILHELFDYCDGTLYWKNGRKAGWKTTTGYEIVRIKGKSMYVHRAIFCMINGYLPKAIDHIDGNKSNNLIENLRVADCSQNACNRKKRTDNTSGVKGISWHKPRQKWQANICVNQKQKYLGLFNTLEEAKQVVEKARIHYHGSYANHG